MGATDELQAHRCCFGPQNPRKHTIHHLTSLISMAVTGQGGEMLRSHPFCRQSLQNPLQPLPHSRRSVCGQALLALGYCHHQCLCTFQAKRSRIIQLVHAIA